MLLLVTNIGFLDRVSTPDLQYETAQFSKSLFLDPSIHMR